MKFFIALLALLSYFSAFADTTSTPLPASAVWTLVRGSTGAVGWNFVDAPSCWRAAAVDVETRKSSSTYVCRQDLKFIVTYTKPVNPYPNGETQILQCVAPAIGSWTQTRTYTLVNGKWVAGAWSPTTAPAGACITPTVTWTQIADENGSFNVTANSTVRFGADTRWAQKIFSGAGKCDVATFTDPAYGVVKTCQVSGGTVVVVPPPDPPPSGASVTAWVRLANESDPFTLSISSAIRFGDGLKWATKTANGTGACSVNYFGTDPVPGKYKFCEVQVTAPAVTQIAGQMPVVNKALIPAPAYSVPGPRVRAVTAQELAFGGPYVPNPTDVGAFREPCTFSHMNFDDPIVYPGQPGVSHLHTFAGNTSAAAGTSTDNILTTGNSTCTGGDLNRTAYWMPTLIDTRTGAPVVPVSTNFYYKLGYLGVKAGTVQYFPKGLRIIAGDSKNVLPITSPNQGVECVSGGGHQKQIPSCAVGDEMNVSVIFPQCWDGKNLDSPDHKSHMAYATGSGCPSTHPVALPEIALNVHYRVTEPNSGTFWRLSSDTSGPPGSSVHADWELGWDAATNKKFVDSCINGNQDCHDMLLGNGEILY